VVSGGLSEYGSLTILLGTNFKECELLSPRQQLRFNQGSAASSAARYMVSDF